MVFSTDLTTNSIWHSNMARFSLFGDLYIKRLQNFCDGDLHVPGSTRFVHRGGLRCDDIDEMMEKKLTAAAEKNRHRLPVHRWEWHQPHLQTRKNLRWHQITHRKAQRGWCTSSFCLGDPAEGRLQKKCSLWSYQFQIREGQEENKPTSERDVRNRCHQVQRHTAAQRLSPWPCSLVRTHWYQQKLWPSEILFPNQTGVLQCLS